MDPISLDSVVSSGDSVPVGDNRVATDEASDEGDSIRTDAGEVVPDLASVQCPEPMVSIEEGAKVAPQTVLHLHGEDSTSANGPIESYQGTVDQPSDNKFILIPSASNPNPIYEVAVAGEYTDHLDVCDA